MPAHIHRDHAIVLCQPRHQVIKATRYARNAVQQYERRFVVINPLAVMNLQTVERDEFIGGLRGAAHTSLAYGNDLQPAR